MTNTPTLETERLILRQFQPEDADAVFAMYSDPETMKYIPMFPLNTSTIINSPLAAAMQSA